MEVTADADTSGVMIALVPPAAVSEKLLNLAVGTEDLDQQHLTLVYLGSQQDVGGPLGREIVYRAVYDFAMHAGWTGLSGKPNGWGVFANPDENVLVALWDIPSIAEFRAELVGYLRRHLGTRMRRDNHGFTPHQTMSYRDRPIRELPPPPSFDEESHFVHVVVAWGEDPWQFIPLGYADALAQSVAFA